jgi:hypothetical protein
MTELTVKKWITASFLGWLCGIVVVIFTSGLFDAIGLEGYQFYLGISVGGSVGFFQQRMLSRTAGIGMQWIWWSMLGMGLPFLLFDLLKIYGGASFGNTSLQYSIALGGALTSGLQSLLLRQKGYYASRWLLTGWSGWVLATATVLAVDYTKYITDYNWALFVINLTLILSGGVVLGAITGLPLLKILKRSD